MCESMIFSLCMKITVSALALVPGSQFFLQKFFKFALQLNSKCKSTGREKRKPGNEAISASGL